MESKIDCAWCDLGEVGEYLYKCLEEANNSNLCDRAKERYKATVYRILDEVDQARVAIYRVRRDIAETELHMISIAGRNGAIA